jgi:DnaJ-class molecular chaperone
MAITLEQLRAALDTNSITSILEQTENVSIDVNNYYEGIASLKLSYSKFMSSGDKTYRISFEIPKSEGIYFYAASNSSPKGSLHIYIDGEMVYDFSEIQPWTEIHYQAPNTSHIIIFEYAISGVKFNIDDWYNIDCFSAFSQNASNMGFSFYAFGGIDGESECVICNGTGNILCVDCDGTGKDTCYKCKGETIISCTNCGGDGIALVSCTNCGGDGSITETCSTCGGDGKISASCSSCGGSGTITASCSSCGGSGAVECSSCGGTGSVGGVDCRSCAGNGYVNCSTCGGDGKVTKSCSTCGGDGVVTTSCSRCGGDGKIIRICSTCGGDGKVSSTCSVCRGTGKVTCPICNGTGISDCQICSGDGLATCKNCSGNGIAPHHFAFYSIPVTMESYEYFTSGDSFAIKFTLKELL